MFGSPVELVTVVLTEVWRNRILSLICFVGITLAVLAVSWHWPKVYVSEGIVESDNENILKPLMEGTAVATRITDYAKNASQLIFSRRGKERVMELLSSETRKLTETQQDILWEQITSRTQVLNVGHNLIKITHRSSDPIRAQLLAEFFTDLFIAESIDEKRRESEEAFNFIANQAGEYHHKLLESETALKEFRSDNLGADPDSLKVVSSRILELQRSIEQSNLAINEAKIRQENIKKQLTGEAEVSAHLTRGGLIQERISALQTNLDTLRMTYLDSYPDIVILKDQIASLKETMSNLNSEPDTRLIDNGKNNPLFQELRAKHSQYATELAALHTRVLETRQLLADETARAHQINNGVAFYAQLTRDYKGNQELYQKLLKQREQARVSMNIDIANQGLTLKIKERPIVPVRPKGIGFIHFAAIGVILGVGFPVGLSFLLLMIDGRMRSVSAIRSLGGPVLGSIPTYRNTMYYTRNGVFIGIAAVTVVTVFGIYGYVGMLRMAG